MITKLARIAELAKNNKEEKFTSLAHLIDKQALWDSHLELPKQRATGVDRVSKEQYEEHLEENLDNLEARLKRKGYRPLPSRRTYIPKDEKSKRPLGIPAYEDKIVQKTMSKILQAIYEQDFLDCSYGFRPQRGQHMALLAVDRMMMREPIQYIVDADIKGFFNHVDHDWMMKFLEKRIVDPSFLRLIHKFLKAGIMEQGVYEETTEGTPQGGLISPILANVYLHYALDVWFEEAVKRACKGKACMVRFADDFVCGFQYKAEAENFYAHLIERLAKFGLEVAVEKTKIIRFGRGAHLERQREKGEKPGTFDFLGFTHYWGKGKSGKHRLMRKTSKKKFGKRIEEFTDWMKKNRHEPEILLVDELKSKLMGHYRYYGVSDNSPSIRRYYDAVLRIMRKWRSRRSQKGTFTYENLTKFLARNELPLPKIYVNLYSSRDCK